MRLGVSPASGLGTRGGRHAVARTGRTRAEQRRVHPIGTAQFAGLPQLAASPRAVGGSASADSRERFDIAAVADIRSFCVSPVAKGTGWPAPLAVSRRGALAGRPAIDKRAAMSIPRLL